MLEHLSKERFLEQIANYKEPSDWIYRGIYPAVVVFHDSTGLYEKGLRDVYEPLKELFPEVKYYQVLMDRDPEIALAYHIRKSPATLFIPPTGTPVLKTGFLTPDEAKEEVERLIEGKIHAK